MLNPCRLSRALLLVAPLLLLGGSVLYAQSEDPAALRRELTDLKRSVEGLNAKIESLERRLVDQRTPAAQEAAEAAPQTSDTPSPPAPGTRPQERWQRLTQGMTFQDVEALLGRPQRMIDVSPKTVWYYAYPDIGSGSVVFNQESGVIDWQAPPFNTWW